MVSRMVSAALVGLCVAVSSGPGAASPIAADMAAGMTLVAPGATAAELIHYRAYKSGRKRHRRAGEPFILRRPDYGLLPYIYHRRATYPYRCVRPTAAQFHYCRERFLTYDPVQGAWISYAPYGHLCACR